eukprot:473057-Rhodomonas_salina.3
MEWVAWSNEKVNGEREREGAKVEKEDLRDERASEGEDRGSEREGGEKNSLHDAPARTLVDRPLSLKPISVAPHHSASSIPRVVAPFPIIHIPFCHSHTPREYQAPHRRAEARCQSRAAHLHTSFCLVHASSPAYTLQCTLFHLPSGKCPARPEPRP